MEIFRKTLKYTDVADRLSFPTRSLKKLAKRFQGRLAVLPVKDKSNRFWTFHCSIRTDLGHKSKNYPKPVLSGDWHRFVVSNDLKFGDEIKLFEEIDQATGRLHYRVEVKKKISLKLLGDLKEDPKDEYLALLRAVIKCQTCPERYFEKVLRLSIKGLGTDEEALTRVVVTRAEVDLKRIAEQYCRRNSITLESDIKGDTSGDYERMLLALIGHEN